MVTPHAHLLPPPPRPAGPYSAMRLDNARRNLIECGEHLIDRAAFWLGFGTPLGHWFASRCADALNALCTTIESDGFQIPPPPVCDDNPPPTGGSGVRIVAPGSLEWVRRTSRTRLIPDKQWGANGIWTAEELGMHQPQNHVILSDMQGREIDRRDLGTGTGICSCGQSKGQCVVCRYHNRAGSLRRGFHIPIAAPPQPVRPPLPAGPTPHGNAALPPIKTPSSLWYCPCCQSYFATEIMAQAHDCEKGLQQLEQRPPFGG